MTEFYPPVQERETDDLMEIAISKQGEWQVDIVNQAKKELLKRGISIEEIEETKEKYEDFLKREELNRQKQLKENEEISYKTGEMILIVLITPFILLGKSYNLTGLSLGELKEENFKLKYNQRLFSLIIGLILWMVLIRFAMTK